MKRSPYWSRFAGRTCDFIKEPHWTRLYPMEGSHVTDLWTAVAHGKGLCKKFVEVCLPREGIPHRTRARVWGNGGRDSVWQTNPLLFTACEEKVEKNGVQLSLGRILWERGRYFYLFIIISQAFPFIFSVSVQLRRGVTQWLWWVPAFLPGPTHHTHIRVCSREGFFAGILVKLLISLKDDSRSWMPQGSGLCDSWGLVSSLTSFYVMRGKMSFTWFVSEV